MADHESDVVIVGYGGAGAAAALAAANAGAKVLILEKHCEGGGNTKYSGGAMRTYPDLDKAVEHIETLCDGTTERDVVETYVKEASRDAEWLKEMGAQIAPLSMPPRFPYALPLATFPSIRGAEGIGPRWCVKGAGEAAGIDLWALLSRKVVEAGIKILYSSPVKKLVMENGVGVTGVIAESGDKDISVRARRAVILTCGGFEYDTSMHRNYLGQNYFGIGNLGNTGDGIRLAGEIGADLWHMNAAASTLGYKFPDFEFAIRHSMPYAGFIYVDQKGKRFMDEPGTDNHMLWSPTSYIDTKTLERPRIPCYVIFDEDTRARGAVGLTGQGRVSDVYQWSADNSAEIRKGWIRAAESLADLAYQINIRPDQLQATVAQYNLQCVGGYDPEHGRAPHTLIPIARAPYYAMELHPCLFNTQGGPKRNSKAQVLDVWGKPIRRLYSAGELGSLWNRNYPGSGNVSEALVFGRLAGKNAAGERAVTA